MYESLIWHARLVRSRCREGHGFLHRISRCGDHLLLAINDRDVTTGINLREVTSVQPAIGLNGLARRLGIAEIALHYDRATHRQLAHLTRSKRSALFSLIGSGAAFDM